ncbi:MAG TPA: ATP-binding cassette domain-containing protein [Gryllotalpicola sp.]
MTLVEAVDVTVSVAGRTLVRDAGLMIGAGEVLGIVGPNGAGKSTVLRALAGLIPIAEGQVRLAGRPLRDFSARSMARQLAFVPQDHTLTAEFTVLDLVLIGRYAHRRRWSRAHDDDERIARAALARVGVAHLADRLVPSLSGGERQLVHLARALAQDTPVVLLDEPTAALDLGHQLQVFALLRGLAADGRGIGVVLHDLNHAARFCDRLAVLAEGRVCAVGDPARILTADLLAQVYGIDALVRYDPAVDAPQITPLHLVPAPSGSSIPAPSRYKALSMHRSPTILATSLLGAAALLLTVTGCTGTASAQKASPASARSSATTSYPLTLNVPGQSQPLTLAKQPKRIAVLSPDASIAVDELVGTSRIVAATDAAKNTTLNPRAADFSAVPHTITDDTNPNPEQVLSWKPDLVVVTARHTGEQDASSQLSAAGAPVLSLTNNWGTVQDVTDNLTLLGTALNAQAEAASLVKQINDGVAAATAKTSRISSSPSVLVLSNQAPMPFINASDVITSELITDAGGTNAATAAGAHATMPVNPEQVVKASPDYIMLVDVLGKGQSSFQSILSNPAVANLPAVKDGHVKLFQAQDVYGVAGTEIVTGIQQIMSWIHPELN